MKTEAQKKANAKYEREKVKQINLRFYPKEMSVYEKAKEMGSRAIKKLIADNK